MLLLHHAYLQNDLETFSKLIESINTTQVGSRKKKQSVQAQVLDVNQVDKYGRTVLHLASSDGQLDFVQCLITAKQLNLLKADRESGWTALHRALYNGKVAVARLLLQQVPPRSSAFQGLVQAYDLEGNTPFDVYNSTIAGVNPDVHDFNLGSSDLFTFGSNANHTLGFADNDDRAYPERVNIVSKALSKDAVRFQAPKIRDVQMAKYHTLVITNESIGNLYVCGFAKEGRLGLPGGTRFKFEPISIGQEICSVAVAQNHSLVLTTDGEVFSWGSNVFHQLGYDTERLSYEAAPRKIFKPTKDRVHGIAVSLIHSVFYTSTGVYTWGANEGQLGHEFSPTEQLISSPRKVASIVGPIIQCSASRFATICLMQSQEVLILTGYGYFKLAMQLERFAFELGARVTNRTLHLNQVTKTVSGYKTILIITNIGDVYEVVVDENALRTKANVLGKSIRPNRVWSPKKRHLAVRDAAVGIEGTIILVTESGSVLTGTRRTSKKSDAMKSDYKFNIVSGVTRAVQVRGSDHGSYAVIREDVPLEELHLGATDLSEDLLCALPYAEDILEEDEHDLTTQAVANHDENDEVDVPLPQHVIKATEMLQKDNLPDFIAHDSHDLTMVLEDGFQIPLHTTICGARSPLLARVLQGTKVKSLTLVDDRDPKELRVEMPISRIAAVLVVHWLYTGIILKPWLGCSNTQRPLMLACQHQAMQFATFLELTSLAKFLEKPFSSHSFAPLGQSFGRLQHNMTNAADCRIHLADGTIDSHSAVLCARSEFFDAMFSGAWLSARREENDVGRIDIQLRHISLAVMKLVIDHIFCDRDLNLFDETECADVDEYLELVMQVLAVANELILPRLKEVCQVVLRQHVHRKTISFILEEADRYHADDLKSACLLYCAQNLQLLVENNLLRDTSQTILQDLDHTISRLQTDKMPVSKSNLLLSELIQRNPSMLDDSEANQKHYLEELLMPTNGRVNLLLFPKRIMKTPISSSPLVRPTITEDALIFEMDNCDITRSDQPSVASQQGRSVEDHRTSKSIVASTEEPIRHPKSNGRSNTMDWQTVQYTKAVPLTPSPIQQTIPAKTTTSKYQASPATPVRQSQSERKKSAQSLHVGSYGAPGSSPRMWSPAIHTPVSMKDIMKTESRPVSSSSETRLSTSSSQVTPTPSASRVSSSLQRPSVLAGSISPSNNGRSLSLAQIIAAEEQEKTKVVEYQAKRSMKEIQQAEEAAKQAADFEKWFQEESRRLQAEQNPPVNGAKLQRSRKGKQKKTDAGSSFREKH